MDTKIAVALWVVSVALFAYLTLSVRATRRAFKQLDNNLPDEVRIAGPSYVRAWIIPVTVAVLGFVIYPW